MIKIDYKFLVFTRNIKASITNMEQLPVNMYFSSNGIREQVLTKENPSMEYIIFQNNELHTKLSNLKDEYNELEVEKNEKEEEVDGLTKSRTTLQGYVKNEYELAMNWRKLSNIYEKSLKKYEKLWILSVSLNILLVIMISFIFNNNLRFTLLFVYLTSYAYLNGKKIYELRVYFKENEVIINSKNEIKKINKGNAYIQELVDNV